MAVIRKRIVVSGRVQGVWFRASTRAAALEIGVAGWVRNLPDGSVEAVFEGSPEGVERAVEWARSGPERADVTSLDVFAENPEGLSGFEVR